MRHIAVVIVSASLIALAGLVLAQSGESVVNTRHNLSASGPGPVRAASEEQVCIFCHTPHHASTIRPLWNRYMPTDQFTIYSSTSLDAKPGQPTGASKMCLSCHDGTIALGNVVSRQTPIVMRGGVTTMPEGPTNLTTDLSDDHPISFRYDSSLVVQDPKLVHPSQLPRELKLDANSELQCTTCHDPHNEGDGDFLVMSNVDSMLCVSCHQISTTTVQAHRDCVSCHQTHSAPSGPLLLRRERPTGTCIRCHDGSHQNAFNIQQDLNKISVHDTDPPADLPDPIPDDTTCIDCHEPHTMMRGQANAPDIHPNFGEIEGVNLAGTPIMSAMYEYEVCFKCHADESAVQPYISRSIVQANTRLEFDPSSISYHPVVSQGQNSDVPSLLPPWNESSIMYCTDCHASDNGPGGPKGAHGSNEPPLLKERYETLDYTSETAQTYALCYACHDRNSILGDDSFPEHNKHIVEERTPCSVCHDAHGISYAQGTTMQNSHLINFDVRVVRPDPDTGLLKFEDLGFRSGRCFLECHGEKHHPETYGQ